MRDVQYVTSSFARRRCHRATWCLRVFLYYFCWINLICETVTLFNNKWRTRRNLVCCCIIFEYCFKPDFWRLHEHRFKTRKLCYRKDDRAMRPKTERPVVPQNRKPKKRWKLNHVHAKLKSVWSVNLAAAPWISLRPTFNYKLGERFKARLPVNTPQNLYRQKVHFSVLLPTVDA